MDFRKKGNSTDNAIWHLAAADRIGIADAEQMVVTRHLACATRDQASDSQANTLASID
jgi:hypothetical protein